MDKPCYIDLSRTGKLELGYLTVVENSKLPFEIKRVYWTYFTPDSVVRGHHAHLCLQQLIVSVSGTILMTLEDLDGTVSEFRLDSPNIGLYIPKLIWRTIKMSHNAVLLCLASQEYDENDYIRDYSDFEILKRNKNV